MTDARWPRPLDVDFVPEELYRTRMAVLRSQRIAAWGWLGLSIVATVLLVIPLVRADGLQVLAALWVVLLAGMLFVTVKTFVVLARCRAWLNGEQPRSALRLSTDGLWLAGLPTYDWESIHALRTRTTLRRHYLIVDLKPGAEPDTPTVAGLNELRPAGRRFALSPRGPRILLRTVAISTDQLRDAVELYSGGRTQLIS